MAIRGALAIVVVGLACLAQGAGAGFGGPVPDRSDTTTSLTAFDLAEIQQWKDKLATTSGTWTGFDTALNIAWTYGRRRMKDQAEPYARQAIAWGEGLLASSSTKQWEHYDILTRVVRAWDDLLGQPRVALQRLEKDFLETLRDRWATNLRGIQVNLLIKLARYDEAQQICEKLIHDYPLCWMPRETLLKWLAETGEREASNTLKTDGRRVGLFSKAKVLQASGRFEESAAICRQLLDDMPTSAAGGWLLLKRETTERLKRLEARVQP